MQIGADQFRGLRGGNRPRDRRGSAVSFSAFRRCRRLRWRALDANDLVDLGASCRVIPSAQLAHENDADTGAALAAKIQTASLPVIQPVAVASAAERVRFMTIVQAPRVETELREDFTPAVAGALD